MSKYKKFGKEKMLFEEYTQIVKKNDLSDYKKLFVLLSKNYPNKMVFSTSMGMEDQIITYLIYTQKIDIEIFTIDTGRLFQATYDTLEKTQQKYNLNIKVYFPDHILVQNMINKKGVNLFYKSTENRKECCYVRKIEPLQRALKNKKIWVTGLRKSQSENRKQKKILEWDEVNKIIKFYPLFNWNSKDMINFVKNNDIPYNLMHDKDFKSIGCEPCTRAILKGEDERAGRWWWENSKKECGLHH